MGLCKKSMNILVGRPSLLLIFLCVAVVYFYWPGTTGGFVLDDIASLEQLGYHNRIDSFEKLAAYVFGGITGPGGRPVALLSFAANAQTWPADPYYFIATNILIHVVNVVLLYWFLTALFAVALPELKYKRTIVILACALWALHPLHVSTVLYVVQRMTLLATMFSLLTFVAYLQARCYLLAGRYFAGVAVLGCAAVVAALGFFSKEIVVLLPLQLLLIEFLCVVRGGVKRSGALVWVFWGCLVPASIVVVSYPVKLIIENAWCFVSTGAELKTLRPFTMFERLLTEQRVLGDYLVGLLLPKMQSAGVFYDDYKVSSGLLNPPSTLVWLLLHAGLLLISYIYRREAPLLFFGIWWFYLGHLMESTAPMLEIKFDHRNYLPSIGLLLLLACAISSLKGAVLRRVGVIGVLVVYSSLLFMGSSLWGRPLMAAMVWVENSPRSPRALEHAASLFLTRYGASKEVERLLQRSIEVAPKVDAELKYMGVFCETYDGEPVNWRALAVRVQKSDRDWSLYPTLKQILDGYISKKCSDLDLGGYLSVLRAYQSNPAYLKTNSFYLVDDLAIRAALAFNRLDLAKEYADKASERLVPLAFQMNRALFFADKGEVQYAVTLLGRAIAVAEASKNENDFTMINAREILQLMQVELME